MKSRDSKKIHQKDKQRVYIFAPVSFKFHRGCVEDLIVKKKKKNNFKKKSLFILLVLRVMSEFVFSTTGLILQSNLIWSQSH